MRAIDSLTLMRQLFTSPFYIPARSFLDFLYSSASHFLGLINNFFVRFISRMAEQLRMLTFQDIDDDSANKTYLF